MARLVTDGGEFGDLLFWSTYSGIASATDQYRSGAYSYKTNANAYGTKNHTAISEGYLRAAVRLNITSGNSKIFTWRYGTTELGSIRINYSTLKFEAYTSTSTLVATGSFVSSLNTWYLLEVHIKIDDSTGVIQLKIDGIDTLDIDYSGDTKPGSDTTFNNFQCIQSNVNTNMWFDDIALNDTSGGADNSWCGDGKVILLNPNANGDSSDFVGSDGNSTDNYALVDEIPPSSTDYVEGSTTDDLDLYNLEASGLSSVTILRIWPEARGADTVAEGGQIYLPVTISGSQYDGTAVTLLTTYTKQLLGDVRAVNPYTSVAWTISDLDVLQVGAKVV